MIAPTAMRAQKPGVPTRRFLMLDGWFNSHVLLKSRDATKYQMLKLLKGFLGEVFLRLSVIP